jgi:hypothetical protein
LFKEERITKNKGHEETASDRELNGIEETFGVIGIKGITGDQSQVKVSPAF